MTLTKKHTQQLRGIAIVCVLLIHTLATVKGIYTDRPFNLVVFFLDQASRISVPLFLMVSGYGLSKSFESKKTNILPFLFARFIALIPAYVLWTSITILINWHTPQWTYAGWPPPLWEQFFLGHGDYHLYFVPIILQLYLLFPLMYMFIRKKPLAVWGIFAIQLLTFYYFKQQTFTDGFEYTILTSWIGYFALGIWLSSNEISKKVALHLPKWSVLALVAVTIIAWVRTIDGIDPLYALKFTRFDLLFFTIPACLFFFTKNIPQLPLLSFIGKNSFVLYLSHTLFLRIISAFHQKQLEPLHLFGIGFVWTLTVLLTLLLMRKKMTN